MLKELSSNNYYIYFHINPIKQEIFYVGKGKDRRAYSTSGRNKFWKNIVNKYNYNIFIIENNLSLIEANDREKYYIKTIGRLDLHLGSLVNYTDGGDGGTNPSNSTRLIMRNAKLGKKASIETKNKMSKSQKGLKLGISQTPIHIKNNKLSHIGKKHSDKTKDKMSKSAMGKNIWSKGKKLSDETKLKISTSMKKRITLKNILYNE